MEMNKTNEFHTNQPKQAVERKYMIIDENPHLINSLNRFHNHPKNRKYSTIPFNN